MGVHPSCFQYWGDSVPNINILTWVLPALILKTVEERREIHLGLGVGVCSTAACLPATLARHCQSTSLALGQSASLREKPVWMIRARSSS